MRLFRCLIWIRYSNTRLEYLHGNPLAFFGQSTKYGSFMVLAFAVALAYDYALLSIFLFIAAASSNSTMVFVALGAVLLVRMKRWNYGYYLCKYAIILGVVGLVGLYAFSPQNMVFFDGGRYEVWDATIKAWWNGQRLFGFGPGSFGVLFAENFQPKSTYGHGIFTRAHNDYIQAIFEFGVPAIIAFVALFACSIRYYRRFLSHPRLADPRSQIASECIFAGICANALANFPFQLAPHYLLGLMALVVLLKSLKDSDTIIKR